MQTSITSRAQVHVHRFSLLVMLGVPLLAIFLQAYVPIHFRLFSFLDLPLVIVIFFAVERHEPVAGMLMGALVGLVQDGLTQQPIGLYGIAKTVVGFLASSLGVRFDAENPSSRFLVTVGFYLLHQGVYFVVGRGLAGEAMQFRWGHLAIAALVNGALAVPLFALLDQAKQST